MSWPRSVWQITPSCRDIGRDKLPLIREGWSTSAGAEQFRMSRSSSLPGKLQISKLPPNDLSAIVRGCWDDGGADLISAHVISHLSSIGQANPGVGGCEQRVSERMRPALEVLG